MEAEERDRPTLREVARGSVKLNGTPAWKRGDGAAISARRKGPFGTQLGT